MVSGPVEVDYPAGLRGGVPVVSTEEMLEAAARDAFDQAATG